LTLIEEFIRGVIKSEVEDGGYMKQNMMHFDFHLEIKWKIGRALFKSDNMSFPGY